MRDLVIHLTHNPGELAGITNALSLQGVNIKSLAAMTLGGQALLRLIPDDLEAARNALRASNIRFEEQELVTVRGAACRSRTWDWRWPKWPCRTPSGRRRPRGNRPRQWPGWVTLVTSAMPTSVT